MDVENIFRVNDIVKYLENKIFKFIVKHLDENLEYLNVEQKDYGVCEKMSDYMILNIQTQYDSQLVNGEILIGDCDIKVIFKSELYLGEYILLVDEVISDFKNERIKAEVEIEDLDLIVNAIMSIEG